MLVAVIWILVMVVSHLGLRRGHRYRPWQNKMAGVLVVSLALIIGIPLGVGSVFARVQSDTVASLFGDSTGKAHSAEDLWADKPYINVFLMGRDNGDDREGTRPDTMLVASIDTKTGNAALISVPRNLAFPVFPEGSELERPGQTDSVPPATPLRTSSTPCGSGANRTRIRSAMRTVSNLECGRRCRPSKAPWASNSTIGPRSTWPDSKTSSTP